MPIKISKAVKDLNIGMQTARDFLKKNNIEVDDNVNARISDDAYNLLIQKFKPAMQQKKAAEQIIHDRKEEKAAIAAEKKRREAEEIKPEVVIQKPKVVGKIELDTKGNPVAPKPADTPAPEPEVKEEKPQQPAPVAAPEASKAETKPQPQPEKAEPQPEKEVPTTPQQVNITPQPTANAPLMQGPKVVGKIDLDALNQSTRPKKKTKEEKRNERLNKEKARQGDGEKRKRKRIGKEKVDIEKSVQQQAQGANQPKRNAQPNAQNANAGKRNKKDKNKRPFKAEVNEEDVQRQMKETLARLTNKPAKKGAKWRREKREAIREEERAEAAVAAAESRILKLTEFVTANDLAAMMNVPINKRRISLKFTKMKLLLCS